jgi:hypothetical protein
MVMWINVSRLLLALLVAFGGLVWPLQGPEQEIARLATSYGLDPWWVLAVATVETQDGRLLCWNGDGSADVGRLQMNSKTIQTLGFCNTTQGPVDYSQVTVQWMVDHPDLTTEAGVITLRWLLHEALDDMGLYDSLFPENRNLINTGRVWRLHSYDLQHQALMKATAWYNGGPGSEQCTWYVYRVLEEYRDWRNGSRRRLPPLRADPEPRQAVVLARRRWEIHHLPEHP